MWLAGFAALLGFALCGPIAAAEENTALYQAYWAGMPAGQIRLTLHDEPAAYHAEIAVRSEGFPRLMTRFRGTAISDGRLSPAHLPAPLRYEARYDLRKGRDRHLSMLFSTHAAASVASRGPDDTSRKPPIAEQYRTNVLDPLSVVTAIRDELRHGNRGSFTIPVYDGARRFDVRVHVLPKRGTEPILHLELTLSPIAGFKGETSDDGDPDTAPRPVALTISDNSRLMPLSMTVAIYYLPLIVELKNWCAPGKPCGF